MTRTRLGSMGLCAVIVGVMAMSAGSAQGALSWLVLNSAGTEAKELKALLVGERDSSHLILLSTISKLMISIVCTNFELEGLNLEAGGTLTTGGKIKFTSCAVYAGTFFGGTTSVLNTTLLPCTVDAGGGAAGTVLSNKVKGKLVLHEGSEVLVELSPEIGATLATLRFGGLECPLPAEDPISGVLFFKDFWGQATTHTVWHLLEAGPLTTVKLGTASASLLGTTLIRLGGEHFILAWSAMDA